MNTQLKTTNFHRLMAAFVAMSMSGCQGGLTGIPSLSNLNNPSRVPPISTGSFQIPPNYAGPSSSGATTPRPTTLGQLRSLETGRSVGDKIGSDGFVASELTNGSFTSKPVVAQSVSTLQSSANQFNRSVEAASAAFSNGMGMNSSSIAQLNSSSDGSKESVPGDDGPAVIQASAIKELPDPRLNDAARASISSDEGIQWKSSQR